MSLSTRSVNSSLYGGTQLASANSYGYSSSQSQSYSSSGSYSSGQIGYSSGQVKYSSSSGYTNGYVKEESIYRVVYDEHEKINVVKGFLIGDVIHRDEEKTYLRNLNERLEKYVTYVKNKSMSKQQLVEQIRHETRKLSVQIFSELSEAYRLKIKEQDDLIQNKLVLNANLQARIEERKTEITKLEYNVNAYKESINILLKQKQDLEAVLFGLRDRRKGLESQLHDWEGRYAKYVEEVEITIRTSIQDVIVKFDHEHDLLVAELQLMRDTFNERLEKCRLDIVRKIELHVNTGSDHKLIGEIKHLEIVVRDLEAERSKLDLVIKRKKAESKELKAEVKKWLSWRFVSNGGDLAMSEAEIIDIFEKRLSHYYYLMQENIQLVTELNAYHLLLCGEEWRLRIHTIVPVDDNTGRSFVSKGHSDIEVIIDEINMQGNYIHLSNKGKKDYTGWRIFDPPCNLDSYTIEAGVANEANKWINKSANRTYTIRSHEAVRPGQTVTIWSHNSGGTHNPPEQYEATITWPRGNRMRAELIDQRGTSRAWFVAYYEEDPK